MSKTKATLLCLSLLILASGCTSVKQYNQNLAKAKSPKELQSDVDYLYRVLQRNHPQLYWYISKKELDYKFDSLKASITQPMTSREFYYRLSPVVTSIKEGHTQLKQVTRSFKKEEADSLRIEQFGLTPFSKMKFAIFDNRLFIIKNKSWNKSIQSGTELLKINGTDVPVLLDKFRSTITADGFVKTFKDRSVANRFPRFAYYNYDFSDSLSCLIRYNDTLKTVVLHRAMPRDTAKVKDMPKVKRVKQTSAQRDSARNERKRRELLGFDSSDSTFSKNLSFLGADKSIALMKLNDFVGGKYSKFYKQSFEKMDSMKVQTLIIDLRDNPGGRESEIRNLYSYLVDSTFRFSQKSEITSNRSMLVTAYFKGTPWFVVPFITPFYPFWALYAIKNTSRGDDGKLYFKISKKENKPSSPHFKGSVYVLINGSSFSASCLLSSNLKGKGRAIFVGEETGGAFNGTVAGRMPDFVLPNSKLKIRVGLLCMKPVYQTNVEGRGVIPDVTITPTLDDMLKENDPELNWVLKHIENRKKTNKEM